MRPERLGACDPMLREKLRMDVSGQCDPVGTVDAMGATDALAYPRKFLAATSAVRRGGAKRITAYPEFRIKTRLHQLAHGFFDQRLAPVAGNSRHQRRQD